MNLIGATYICASKLSSIKRSFFSMTKIYFNLLKVMLISSSLQMNVLLSNFAPKW